MNLYVGILCTFSPLKYGISKTGKTIYKCQPIDYSLPTIKIVYGGKLNGKIVVVFKLNSTQLEESMPLGEIYHVIGVANPENLVSTLLYHFSIVRKPFQPVTKTQERESTIQRKDLTHFYIYSIDPKGCRDIDDAFSFERVTQEKTIVGVHIAQPVCFLTKEEMLNRVESAFSTLYLGENEMIPLWSESVQQKSSLLKNESRPAYSVFFTFEKNKCIGIEAYPTIIMNKYPTHYDDLTNPRIVEFLEWTRELLQQPIDTHELVSHWMLETNQYIGSTHKVPYRVQAPTSNPNETIKCNDVNTEIQNVFRHYTMEKASYSLDTDIHASLERQKYTHFTSPIRRIMDCLIHWQITYGESLEYDLQKINQLDQATKKFHRMLELNKKIDSIQESQIKGYLYEKVKRGAWRLYFPELGFIKVKIVDDRLEHLICPEKELEYVIGGCYPFSLNKKPGFLPMEKIILTPLFKITE